MGRFEVPSGGGAEFGLARPVAVGECPYEPSGAGADIREESAPGRRLIRLMRGDETEDDADGEPEHTLHGHISLRDPGTPGTQFSSLRRVPESLAMPP